MLSLTECSSQLHELVGAQPRKRDRQHSSTVSTGNYFYTKLQSNVPGIVRGNNLQRETTEIYLSGL